MKNFAIVEPFQLDWRMAAPHDYESLEYFVTPQVSLLFNGITNGNSPFYIGSFIMEDASKQAQFMNEVMPQRSAERIEKAFKDEDISVLFTLEDAQALKAIFEKEGFICRRVEVLHEGKPVNVTELNEFDFDKVIKTFAELKVVSVMDFDTQWENISEQVEEMREDIARGMRRQHAERDAKLVGMTKQTMFKRGAIGGSLLAISGVLAGLSKSLISKKTKTGVLLGALTGVISIATGIAGKQLTTTIIEHVQKGLILNYG